MEHVLEKLSLSARIYIPRPLAPPGRPALRHRGFPSDGFGADALHACELHQAQIEFVGHTKCYGRYKKPELSKC